MLLPYQAPSPRSFQFVAFQFVSHESDSPSVHKFLFGLFGSQAKSRLWIDVVHSWFLPEACFLGKKQTGDLGTVVATCIDSRWFRNIQE